MTTLNFGQLVTNWFQQNYQRRAFRRAISRAYDTFAERYPEWAASHFDEYFLTQQLNPSGPDRAFPGPSELADAWTRQTMWFTDTTRQKLIAELTPVASDYLHWLKTELCHHRTIGQLISQAA